MKHIIKCARSPFQAAWDGKKPFEVRKNDRDYVTGDLIEMYEVHDDGNPTGRLIVGPVSFVLHAERSFGGLNAGYVAFGFSSQSNIKQSRVKCRERLGMSENGERKPVVV